MSQSDHAGAVKTARLCRQVEEILALAIAGCGDDALLDVSVREVAPAGGPGRLLVTVDAPGADPVETLAALGRVQEVPSAHALSQPHSKLTPRRRGTGFASLRAF